MLTCFVASKLFFYEMFTALEGKWANLQTLSEQVQLNDSCFVCSLTTGETHVVTKNTFVI